MIYIAFLRGINVSGQKKIRMAELKSYFEELNFKNVRTYIQSGNVILESSNQKNEAIQKKIENLIKEKFGFDVPVIVKNKNEIAAILKKNPFTGKETNRIYITLLSDIPSAEQTKKLPEINYAPEEFILDENIIYFFSPHGYGEAKMSNNFFEKILKVTATTRNWRTMNILKEMTEN
jgi:uncharacterized protein (DUF1697 family)